MRENEKSWEQDSYETGSTKPPKSRGGLVAVLLVLVILLCGAASYLGMLNIRLGLQLHGADDVPIRFEPAATVSETQDLSNEVLPGVEGRTVTVPEQAYYHWPAGVVVTKVWPESCAAKAGVTLGDIIIAIDCNPVADVADITGYLQTLAPGMVVTVTFYRDDGSSHSFQCTLK